MASQQSILSFFNSAAAALPSSASTTATPPAPRYQRAPLPSALRRLAPAVPAAQSAPAPPPPAPPSSSARPVLRTGGSPAPDLHLAPISPTWGKTILLAAGAEARPVAADDAAEDLVFATAAAAPVRIVFPRDRHVPDLVSVNSILLPVRYPDSFYRLVADRTRAASLFNRVLLSSAGGDSGKVVGGIVCRLELSPFAAAALPPPLPSSSTTTTTTAPRPLAVYIQSLALLSPHRGNGLMAAAVDSIIATALVLNKVAREKGEAEEEEEAAASDEDKDAAAWSHNSIQSVYAHVWTENEDGLRWYEARGFRRHGSGPVENYYYKLRPNTAWILRRDLRVAEQVGAATAVTAPPPPKDTTTTAAKGRPLPPVSSQSYQNARPATEWNDLPEDMVMGSAAASTASSSRAGSRSTSRQVSRQQSLVLDSSSNSSISMSSPPPLDGPPSAGTSAASAQTTASPLLVPPPPPPAGAGATSPSASSISSVRNGTVGRKKRAYPAAMFQQ